MRRALRRALAVASIVALSSSWAVGWSAVLHVATDHHEDDGQHDDADARDHESKHGLQLMLHGHGHADGTPDHRHPVTNGVASSLPGKLLLATAAVIGHAPMLAAGACSSCRLLALGGPTHDPPPRSSPILRI